MGRVMMRASCWGMGTGVQHVTPIATGYGSALDWNKDKDEVESVREESASKPKPREHEKS